MTRKLTIPVFLLLIVVAYMQLAWAEPWAIVANSDNITMVDAGTNPPAAYGPFLSGQMGTGPDELFHVAVTPDGKYALLTNYNQQRIYKVNITNPTNPVLMGFASVSFDPLDIAIAPNGTYAVISTSTSYSSVAFLNVDTMAVSTYNLTTLPNTPNPTAVAISQDSRYVLFADKINYRLIYGPVNGSLTGLVSESVASGVSYPLDVAVSPDGQTVLVTDLYGTIYVFLLNTATGTLTPSGTVSGLPGLEQAVAISPDGRRAYVVSAGTMPNQLSWLNISGPGQVTIGGVGVATLPSLVNDAVFGGNTIDISPDNTKAIIGNPSSDSFYISDRTPFVAIVDLNTFAVNQSVSTGSPFGVAFAKVRLDVKKDGPGATILTVPARSGCDPGCTGAWYYFSPRIPVSLFIKPEPAYDVANTRVTLIKSGNYFDAGKLYVLSATSLDNVYNLQISLIPR